jgi:murein DD-endopeptidase MepM/ murein hydrolase activator NlpD
MPLTDAAQAVQMSAFPAAAYGEWEPAATQLVGHIAAARDCATPYGWVMPVDGVVISGFRTPDRPTHVGIDLTAPSGAVVRAVAAGTVIVVACNASLNGGPYSCDVDGSPEVQGCGWYLEILHFTDHVTRYCHLLRRPDVAVGAVLYPGRPIGVVGSSGNSSGPHLHFEVHTGRPATAANAVDPTPYLPLSCRSPTSRRDGGRQLPKPTAKARLR